MKRPGKSEGLRPVPRQNDAGPTVAAAAPLESGQKDSPHSHAATRAGQALHVIEGASKAAHYLVRLRAQQADPNELARIVSMLYGATLCGFCRMIEKALGSNHA